MEGSRQWLKPRYLLSRIPRCCICGRSAASRLFGEVITRLARVEREVVDLRRDILGLHEDWVGMARRLDNLDLRMARIERRLDLVEVP